MKDNIIFKKIWQDDDVMELTVAREAAKSAKTKPINCEPSAAGRS